MTKRRTISLVLALTALLTSTILNGCAANAPPRLGQQAAVAYNNHRVQRALDLIRDTVQDGNALQPPVFSTATTRKVTIWHKAAITTIHATQTGWQSAVETGLDQLVATLPKEDADRIRIYVNLAKTILKEVTS